MICEEQTQFKNKKIRISFRDLSQGCTYPKRKIKGTRASTSISEESLFEGPTKSKSQNINILQSLNMLAGF